MTATNAAASASSTSSRSAVVAAAPPSATDPPSITGTIRDGETLTADPGGWSGTRPLTFAYQWRRCDADGNGCADIEGATEQTYVAGAGDVDHPLRVVVTATNAGGSSTATSAASDAVAAAAPQSNGVPTIFGVRATARR